MLPKTSFSLLNALQQTEHREEAFQRFDDRYRPIIRHWCQRPGVQDATADDLTQIILTKLWDRLRRFEYHPQKGRFRDWLQKLVGNAVTDFFREQQRHPEPAALGGTSAQEIMQQAADLRAESLLSDLGPLTSTLAGRMNTAEQKAVARVKARVEEKTWEAYYLFVAEKWKVEDIGPKLGLTKAAVYKARHRLTTLIRDEYQQILREQGEAEDDS